MNFPRHRSSIRLEVSVWLLFGMALLLTYYRQFLGLFSVGPIGWIKDTPSLAAALRPIWQLLYTGVFPYRLSDPTGAAARALAAFFGAALVLSAGYALGSLVLGLLHLNPHENSDRILFRLGAGLGSLSYLSFALALLGWYRPGPIRILIPTLIGGKILVWLFRSDRRALRLHISRHSLSFRQTDDRLWFILVLLATGLAFIAALAPETEYDALWYHLWLPQQWLQSGHPVDIIQEYISLYPLTWELLYGMAMTLGGPVAAKLLGWACLPLTGWVVYRLIRRFFPDASPWLGLALLITAPTLLWEATTAYNDLALTFFASLSIYALLQYRFRSRAEEETGVSDLENSIEGSPRPFAINGQLHERSRKWLYLAAISIGLTAAVKHIGLFLLVLVPAGLLLSAWREGRLREALKPASLLLGIGLLIPSPWYLRAWLASGNPFFPSFYTIFGAFPAERWSSITQRGLDGFLNGFGDPRTPLNLLLLPWNLTVHAARYGGSLGPLFLLLMPGLLFASFAFPLGWLLGLAGGYLALWASPFSSFQLRFLLPIVPILSVLAAEGYSRLQRRFTAIGLHPAFTQLALVGLLLLNLPPFLSLHEGDRVGYQGWLTHVLHDVPFGVTFGFETSQDYLARKVRSYQAWQYINQQLPAEARVLTFSGGDQLYSQRDRIWALSTTAFPAVWGAQPGQESRALDTLHRLGITHVLADRREMASLPPDQVAILQPDFVQRWYILEYQDQNFALYRLRQEAAPAPSARSALPSD